jgi:hypothetical protein
MGVLTGLAQFKGDLDGSSSKSKVKYLQMKAGQTVKLWFLEDFDEGTPATDAGSGVVAMITEHQAGDNFRLKAQCTRDTEGKCYACDQAIKNPKKGWGVKKRVYANVLVDDGIEDPYVAVWNIATQRSQAWEVLLEEYLDNGSVASKPWRVKRTGEGTNTTYLLKQLDGGPANFGEYTRFDVSDIIPAVAYEDQQAHYSKVYGEDSSQPSSRGDDPTEEW